MPETSDVLVVGAGLAGLTAGLDLSTAGVRVTVLEAEDVGGGKARTRIVDGAEFPVGPPVWVARRQCVTELAERVGLGDDIVRVPLGARYLVRSRRLRAIAAGPGALLTRAVSLRERFSIVAELLRRSRRTAVSESLASFLRRRFGRSFVAHVAEPALSGIWAGDLETLDAEVCFPELVEYERVHGSVLRGVVTRALCRTLEPPPRGLRTIRGGIGRIARAAASRLDVRTRMRALSLRKRGSGFEVLASSRRGSVRLHARHVVLAVEAPVAAGLLSAVAPRAADALRAVPYAPLCVVHWKPSQPGTLPRGFGYLASPRDGLFALGSLFTSDLLGGPARYATFVGGTLHPARARLSEADLRVGIDGDLRLLARGQIGEIVHIERHDRAVAQPTLGHRDRIARGLLGVADLPISLAGSYVGAGAMHDAIDSGRLAAARAHARLGRS